MGSYVPIIPSFESVALGDVTNDIEIGDLDNDGDIDDIVSTTTTADGAGVDPAGFYEFTGLTPGVEYQVQFDLPAGSIALYPAENRDESRLMVIHKDSGKIEHKLFKDVIDYFNDKGLTNYADLAKEDLEKAFKNK